MSASICNSITSSSSEASSAALNSAYILFFKGWYIESNFCRFCNCLGTVNDPSLFVELANDENVQLRNVAIVATENGVIKLSQDQRTFTWGSNGRKLMNVPFDENPYSAMAAWFKTDEGVEVYKSIEKKLL